MTIYFNLELDFSIEQTWAAANGATRRVLRLINKTAAESNTSQINGDISYLDKDRVSFIFINPARKEDDKIVGVFLCNTYGYDVVSGRELYSNSSIGGPGNSCSKFGIYELGTVIEEFSYKNRMPSAFYKLTGSGWVNIQEHELVEEQSTAI